MNIVVFASANVGLTIVEFLIGNYKNDILAIVTVSKDDIYQFSISQNVPTYTFNEWGEYSNTNPGIEFDYGILAWWPKIIKKGLIDMAKKGFINTHPSLLPHNRGKNYNFWAIVEQAPFGVTLHKVDEGVDTGPILAQKVIPYTWLDNGQTLYEKAQKAMIELFREVYPDLRTDKLHYIDQDLTLGSYHHSSELHQASKIDLNKKYTARELLNLLRARTFSGYPSCWFEDNGHIYEIYIQIKKGEQ